MTTDHAEILTHFPLFEGFTVHGARRLLESGVVRQLPAGEFVCQEGDPPEFVALLITGRLEVFVERDGQHIALTHTEPGTILGELAVYCEIPRSASVRAVQDSAVLQWDARTFHRLLLGDFRLAKHILGQSLRTLIKKEAELIASLAEARAGDAASGVAGGTAGDPSDAH